MSKNIRDKMLGLLRTKSSQQYSIVNGKSFVKVNVQAPESSTAEAPAATKKVPPDQHNQYTLAELDHSGLTPGFEIVGEIHAIGFEKHSFAAFGETT